MITIATKDGQEVVESVWEGEFFAATPSISDSAQYCVTHIRTGTLIPLLWLHGLREEEAIAIARMADKDPLCQKCDKWKCLSALEKDQTLNRFRELARIIAPLIIIGLPPITSQGAGTH